MSNYLVYYRFYHDNIDNPDHPVENIHVQIAYIYSDNERGAENSLLDYFGNNVIDIIKSEKTR